MRLPRPLDEIEARVLGCLLEKQQTTPEYYPLTVNALLAACNQKSNREPVTELTEGAVRGALQLLRNEVLVWPVEGARVERWEHNLDRAWELDPPAKALMTVLLLRGAQTPGELRGRTDRMFPFRSPAEVEEVLRRLAAGPEPLVVELSRAPGHKETRWMHLVSGLPTASAPTAQVSAGSSVPRADGIVERVARLEDQVARLRQELEALASHLAARE